MCIVCHRPNPPHTIPVGTTIARGWLSFFASKHDLVVHAPACRFCRLYFRAFDWAGTVLWALAAIVIIWFFDAAIRQYVSQTVAKLAIAAVSCPVAWAWYKFVPPPLELLATENLMLFRFRNEDYKSRFILINFCGDSKGT
jgi:hypothetical protein